MQTITKLLAATFFLLAGIYLHVVFEVAYGANLDISTLQLALEQIFFRLPSFVIAIAVGLVAHLFTKNVRYTIVATVAFSLFWHYAQSESGLYEGINYLTYVMWAILPAGVVFLLTKKNDREI